MRWLILPFLVYLSLSLLYLLAVPTGESPDEPGHLQCIEQVSILGQLPEIEPKPEGSPWWARGRIISGAMCYHMPLYYLAAGSIQKVVATAVDEPIHYEFPPSSPNFGPVPAMFEHPAKASFWTLTGPVHLLALRLFSIFLGGVVVWASFAVANHFWPTQPLVRLLAALLTAVWPQFIYLSRSLNNDALATALAVLILLILLNVKQPKRFVWATALAILAVFTKLLVLYTVGAVLSVWVLEFWQEPARRQQYLRSFTVCLALLSSAFLLLYLTPTLWLHFNQGSGSFATMNEQAKAWSYWQEVFKLTASSGWVRFGWMNVAAPQSHANVWWGVLLGTAVLGAWFVSRLPEPQSRFKLIIVGLWLAFILLSYIQINLNRLQPQFRFALAAVPVLTSLSASGWFGLGRRNGRWFIVLSASIVVILFLYNIWIVFSVIVPAYPWWSFP